MDPEEIRQKELIDELLSLVEDRYPPDVERFYSREKAEEIIRTAVWGYGVHSGSTASAYVHETMKKALDR